MPETKVPVVPALKEVESGSDADGTPVSQQNGNRPISNSAAAMPQGRKPGPAESPVQVRNAGESSKANPPKHWDDIDEAVDESFPASDPSAKY